MQKVLEVLSQQQLQKGINEEKHLIQQNVILIEIWFYRKKETSSSLRTVAVDHFQ